MKSYPFDVYQKYLAIKFHFEQGRDFTKYKLKLNHSQKTFEARNDFVHFVWLCDKYPDISDIEDLFISNYMYGQYHIISMRSQEAKDIKLSWTSKMQSFSYHLKNDVQYLQEKYSEQELLAIHKKEYPKIIQEALFKKIHLETLVVYMHRYPETFQRYESEYDDIHWNGFFKKFQRFSILCEKYNLSKLAK